MKIKTEYWPKPMPIRSFDWSAIDDDTYDQGAPIGFGATEQEAIKDLYDQVEQECSAQREMDSMLKTEGHGLRVSDALIDYNSVERMLRDTARIANERDDDDYERAAEDAERVANAREDFEP